MKIIITNENSELWGTLASSLDEKKIKLIETYSDVASNTESTWLFCHQPVNDFEQIVSDLHSEQVEAVFVFYRQGEFAISSAVDAGESLEQAVSDWLDKNNALLALQKKNRRKIKLINLDQALMNFPNFISQMEEYGLAIQDTIEYKAKSDLNLLVASQYVRQEQNLTHLNNILTASSLPVTENTAIYLDNASVLKQRASDIQSIQNIEKEVELLNSKIEEKEQVTFQVNKELERERAVVLALKEELKLQNTSMTKHAENAKVENELLELQLASLQEEFEEVYLNFESEKQKHQETELKLTTQVNDTLTNLETVKSEVEILELQLGQVQEELEEYFLANQSKAKQIETLNSELESLKNKNIDVEKQLNNANKLVTSLNSKIANLNASANYKDKAHAKNLQQLKLKQMELDKQTSQIVKAKNEIDILNHNLTQAKAELAQIKSSTFWKSAEPVRRLVKAVGNVDKKKAKLQQNIGLLLTSEYFDAEWYLETYPDVAASEINPAEHYLKFGAQEGRFPSPQFDGNWYLQRYPDIADADINPLIHFIKFGISEGRSASPKMLVNQNKP